MLIQITQEDINLGECGSCTRCPIALGTNRALREHDRVDLLSEVSAYQIELQDEWENVKAEIDLPARARDFVRKFDDGESVQPFCFEIPDPN